MGILNVNHPDVEKFIRAKEDGKNLSNFNISIAVNKDFMERVKADQEYDLVNPRTGKITGQRNAKEIFDLLTNMAWKTGDPGLIFLDVINRDNPNPQLAPRRHRVLIQPSPAGGGCGRFHRRHRQRPGQLHPRL